MDQSNLSSESPVVIFGVVAIVLMTLLACIALLATFIEHKHIHILSEASVASLFGMVVGVTYIFGIYINERVEALPQFDQTFFFFVLLPIIVFKEGYSLNKQHFFKNFFYVALYGILGTIFNFIIVAVLVYVMSANNLIVAGQNEPVELKTFFILYFSSCISSKDSAVTLQVLSFDLTPKLHSIIFGEQILNDIVVFSLQKSTELLSPEYKVPDYWYTTFLFIAIILVQLIVSLLVGVFIGVLATWITKKCRWICHHSSIITAFTVYCGYLSFALCEAFGFCGIVAVLVCGVILSHYLTYNLPKISAQSSKITVKALAYVSETFIYFYIGFSLFTQSKLGEYIHKHYQEPLLISENIIPYTLVVGIIFIILPFARLVSLLLTHLFAIVQLFIIARFRIKTKNTWRVNRYEFFIIFYSGLIRGVVAYALVQELGYYYNCSKFSTQFECQDFNQQLLYVQTTTLITVQFYTIFIGGTLKTVVEWCFNKIESGKFDKSIISNHEESNLRVTFIQGDIDEYKKVNPKSEKLFKRIDEEFLKPLLIYNYKERKEDIKQAKKEERKKMENEKEDDEKMFDDSVRHRRIKKSQKQQQQNSHLTDSVLSNGDKPDFVQELSVKTKLNNGHH